MIKVTHRDIASLIKKSDSYTRQLLMKEGVKMSKGDIEQVIDFIRRHRPAIEGQERPECLGLLKRSYVVRLVDRYFGHDKEFKKFKKELGSCERCGSNENLSVHHKDHNHFNNNPENWECLCSECHLSHHNSPK